MKTNKAFTILELLIVISVLTVLIGIAIPRFKGMQDTANIAKVKSELKTVQAAVESYCTFSQNSRCDFTFNGDVDEMTASNAIQGSYLLSASPLILPKSMTDPFYTSGLLEYFFWSAGSGKCYLIFSLGPNANYVDFDTSVHIQPNYNQTTGVFTPPAAYPNMIYVSNNAKCS